MLVSECIDRVFAEIFWPSGIDRPTYDVLDGDIDDAVTSLTVEGRISNIPRDTMLEIDEELILTEEVATTVVTVNERGWLNSTPVAHTSGTRVYIDPQYTRLAVFNALKACIGLLYPWGLYWRRVVDGPAWNARGMHDLEAGTKHVHRVLVAIDALETEWTSLKQPGDQWEVFNEFSTPKIQFLRGGGQGRSTKIVSEFDFTQPANVLTDLDDCGIPSTLQPFLPLAVAGYILQNREVPRVQVDDVRRLLAAQGIQVGASMNVGQAMINQFRSVYVPAERTRLLELDPLTFEFVGS